MFLLGNGVTVSVLGGEVVALVFLEVVEANVTDSFIYEN